MVFPNAMVNTPKVWLICDQKRKGVEKLKHKPLPAQKYFTTWDTSHGLDTNIFKSRKCYFGLYIPIIYKSLGVLRAVF